MNEGIIAGLVNDLIINDYQIIYREEGKEKQKGGGDWLIEMAR